MIASSSIWELINPSSTLRKTAYQIFTVFPLVELDPGLLRQRCITESCWWVLKVSETTLWCSALRGGRACWRCSQLLLQHQLCHTEGANCCSVSGEAEPALGLVFLQRGTPCRCWINRCTVVGLRRVFLVLWVHCWITVSICLKYEYIRMFMAAG